MICICVQITLQLWLCMKLKHNFYYLITKSITNNLVKCKFNITGISTAYTYQVILQLNWGQKDPMRLFVVPHSL